MENLRKEKKIIIFQYEKILQNPKKTILKLNTEFKKYGIKKIKNTTNSDIIKPSHDVPYEIRLSMQNMLKKFNLKFYY